MSFSETPKSRRAMCLSPTMLASESISVYDSYSFVHSPSAYKVLCLKESQGFLFNQDLFATPYQQSRSAAQEKRRMSIMRKKRSKSSGHVSFPGSSRPKQRSYSSCYTSRSEPQGSQSLTENAIAEDEPMQDVDDISHPENLEHEHLDHNDMVDQRDNPFRSSRSSISERFNTTFQRGLFDAGATTFSSSEDEMDLEPQTVDYSPIGSNHIPVIDIVVEKDAPLFPENYWPLAMETDF